MAKLKVKLARNLRRSIMRGHPWIYKEALEPASRANLSKVTKADLCQVSDSKGELGWAILDPHSPLALRILNTDKNIPSQAFFEKRFQKAWELRQCIKSKDTNAYRLFNGEGDLLPGLVCDVYDSVAVLQFDGKGPSEFWNKGDISHWILKNTDCKTVIEKPRRGTEKPDDSKPDREIAILERGAKFKVNIDKGQKTGFFLDQRENRNYIREISKNQSVLNLFSYSGGFSVNAGLGGATKVASLDVSKGAIDLAIENWDLNELKKSQHEGLCVDVFEYLKSKNEMWDHIIVDPPSMSHSEDQKELAKQKYIEVFSASTKHVNPQGQLSLSSCSSHITFEDFFEIIDESLSLARRKGRILRVSGQGADHPFPHACHELKYLKFVHLNLD